MFSLDGLQAPATPKS